MQSLPLRAFNLGTLLLLGLSNLASASPALTLTDLGNLGGSSQAFGLNNQGQVVGVSQHSDGFSHAFLWSSSNGMIDLGTLPGDMLSAAVAINDNGQVLGSSYSNDPNGLVHTFLWQPGLPLTNIGAGTGWSLQPLGLSAQGQAVGVASTGAFYQFASGFLYNASSGVTQVTVPGVTITEAYAINNQGQMVLRSPDIENVLFYTPGQPVIEIQSSHNLVGGAALAMNDHGTVVGFIDPSNGDDPHGYIWNPITGLIDLGVGSAHSVNGLDQVVGLQTLSDGSGMAYLYDNGTFYELSSLLGASGAGWEALAPQAINDHGQIAGYGLFGGELQGFLLTPNSDGSLGATSTPEPATLSLLTLAALPLLLLRRRRVHNYTRAR